MTEKCIHCNNEMELVVIDEKAPELAGQTMYVCHTCKKLFRPCEVYSRVVGYIRPVNQWNEGKQSEFKDRVTYKIGGLDGRIEEKKVL
jgi:anaerobic ribonucleoside-triphosphate reductase